MCDCNHFLFSLLRFISFTLYIFDLFILSHILELLRFLYKMAASKPT